jgi:DNA-binding NarL/FixJ family response regulator
VNALRILLADDHTVLRQGLRLLLERQPEFQVIGEAADGHEAIEMAEAGRPDVVALDLGMPRLNGIEAARQITAKLPSTAIARKRSRTCLAISWLCKRRSPLDSRFT